MTLTSEGGTRSITGQPMDVLRNQWARNKFVCLTIGPSSLYDPTPGNAFTPKEEGEPSRGAVEAPRIEASNISTIMTTK